MDVGTRGRPGKRLLGPPPANFTQRSSTSCARTSELVCRKEAGGELSGVRPVMQKLSASARKFYRDEVICSM